MSNTNKSLFMTRLFAGRFDTDGGGRSPGTRRNLRLHMQHAWHGTVTRQLVEDLLFQVLLADRADAAALLVDEDMLAIGLIANAHVRLYPDCDQGIKMVARALEVAWTREMQSKERREKLTGDSGEPGLFPVAEAL